MTAQTTQINWWTAEYRPHREDPQRISDTWISGTRWNDQHQAQRDARALQEAFPFADVRVVQVDDPVVDD